MSKLFKTVVYIQFPNKVFILSYLVEPSPTAEMSNSSNVLFEKPELELRALQD